MKPLFPYTILLLVCILAACQPAKTQKQDTAPTEPQKDTVVQQRSDVIIPRPPERRKEWRVDSVTAFAWEHLEAGLDLAVAEAPIHTNIGDNRLYVLRIDPAHFEFELISAKTENDHARPANEWLDKHNLVAAINAGMYQTDHLTNVGFMKDHGKMNNAKISNDNIMVAFHPATDSLPPFALLDKSCTDWDSLLPLYQSASQGIRMVKCEGKNVWSKQAKYWSTAAIGIDKEGRALFLFTRTPYAVHDFVSMMLQLPIGLQRCMYLEGGPETSFLLRHPKKNLTRIGSFETGFMEDDSNDRLWAIPNMIGIVRK
ncbi:MAG: phosphodiester glycosidase family protein [Bacteroidia bacterium]